MRTRGVDPSSAEDAERRKRLAVFLLDKRKSVQASAKVGTYTRRDDRIGRPFTQEEVAEALGVSRQWYGALEMGSSVRASTALLDRIAKLFSLPDEERATLFSLAIPELAVTLQTAPVAFYGSARLGAFAAAMSSRSEIDVAANKLALMRARFNRDGASVGGVRPRILHSWLRCRELEVDPSKSSLTHRDDVEDRRKANEELLLAAAPVLMDLSESLSGTGFVVSTADAQGCVLEVGGDLETRRYLSRLGYEAGVDSSEECIGTNGIGTAIADRRPLQLLGAEHFCEGLLSFTCTAAPIVSPVTQEMLGVLNVMGSYELARPDLVGFVMQAAFDIEERLALLSTDRPRSFSSPPERPAELCYP
jgi:transcriptional regulator with XRE-family HTH domain